MSKPAMTGQGTRRIVAAGLLVLVALGGWTAWRYSMQPGHSLGITMRNVEAAILIHTMFNAHWEPLIFELPPLRHQPWRRWSDTSRNAPNHPPCAVGNARALAFDVEASD
jgi:hypothetical protein